MSGEKFKVDQKVIQSQFSAPIHPCQDLVGKKFFTLCKSTAYISSGYPIQVLN